jgi:L-threonylcarbamoyladenylate synthase
MTQIIKINEENIKEMTSEIDKAGEILARGGLVSFPTETVYGLGANALDEEAVKNIYLAKGRPSDNPLIVHIARIEDAKGLVTKIPEKAEKLMNRFWPGPLTIILESNGVVAPTVTAGLTSVAIRLPIHPIALEVIKASGVPVAAPSANTSGRPSPTLAEHVIEDLAGKIDMIIDGGPAGVGLESTVIDLTSVVPTILRPGGITKEAIEEVIGVVEIDENMTNETAIPRSPGMKYTHYAPRAPLHIGLGDGSKVVKIIQENIRIYQDQGKQVGVLTNDENRCFYDGVLTISLGSLKRPDIMAQNLYKSLREFDKTGVDVILAEGYAEEGLRVALMNRLKKAAGNKYL